MRGYATVFSIFLLARFQSCSLTDLHCDPLETSEDCQGHSSDKSEPGWNSSFNFQGTRLWRRITKSSDDITLKSSIWFKGRACLNFLFKSSVNQTTVTICIHTCFFRSEKAEHGWVLGSSIFTASNVTEIYKNSTEKNRLEQSAVAVDWGSCTILKE